jgi:hypothetical protein
MIFTSRLGTRNSLLSRIILGYVVTYVLPTIAYPLTVRVDYDSESVTVTIHALTVIVEDQSLVVTMDANADTVVLDSNATVVVD